MTLDEKRKRIVEDLNFLPDRFERFSYLVDYGKDRDSLPDELKSATFQVEGCQSQLWLVPEFRDDKCHFRADSDSSIVKGIACLICDFYSDEEPQAVLAGDVHFLREVGVDQHLSSNRRNGLGKVDERIKRFAATCLEESRSG